MDSFLAFLETEKDRMAHLVILGDLLNSCLASRNLSGNTIPFVLASISSS
jgi:hypothetical protein